MKSKKIFVILGIIVLTIVLLMGINYLVQTEQTDVYEITSESEFWKVAGMSWADEEKSDLEAVIKVFSAPTLFHIYGFSTLSTSLDMGAVQMSVNESVQSSDYLSPDSVSATDNSSTVAGYSSIDDYSTTNVQVENVDEADFSKTDGQYIYSITNKGVAITKANADGTMELIQTITTNLIPEDILLYKNKLVVIGAKGNVSYSYSGEMVVTVYNIENKERVTKENEFRLDTRYYTAREINGMVYILSTQGITKAEDPRPIYYVNNKGIRLDYSDMLAIRGVTSRTYSMITSFSLEEPEKAPNVKVIMADLENAYVSEENIYIADSHYGYTKKMQLSSIFSWKGLFGIGENRKLGSSWTRNTDIYKFCIEGSKVEFVAKGNVTGYTNNQFSFDEYEGNLRVSLTGSEDNSVIILDKNMNKIGAIEGIAKGETIYATRFMGDRAYLVTYRTMDPLFVLDLSNPTAPKILGELKIPGYSTYLHPYDENHIIGIGQDTEEIVRKDSMGRVISTTAQITGMKIALFDVTDVSYPIELSSIRIGDARTTSNILENHKALLFSKEKELLAIPVQYYQEEVTTTTTSTQARITDIPKGKNYLQQGLMVYHINLEDGIEQRGLISHSDNSGTLTAYQIKRGMYIRDNLYTLSEGKIQSNRLDTLEKIQEISL